MFAQCFDNEYLLRQQGCTGGTVAVIKLFEIE